MRRSQTPRPASSRSARPCPNIDAARQPWRCPSSHRQSHRPPTPPAGRRRPPRRSRAGHHGPRRRPNAPGQKMLQPVGCQVRRDARRSSNSSCDPDPPASPTSARRHAATARTEKIAARSGRSPRQTPSSTDQGLRYAPRPPRHLGCSTQTAHDRPVAAPNPAGHTLISANEPNRNLSSQDHDLRL